MGLNCDILFGYNNRREYIGLLNFRNIISMQVQHVFDATSSSGQSPAGMPPMYTGAYTGVNVNGVDFGTGRIVSFSNPVSTDITENGRHLWKQILNVEVYESGDISNISPIDSGVAGLITGFNVNLSALDENFSFDITQEGNYQYSHTANVRCVDDATGQISGYVAAQRIASGLLLSTPPFGFIDVAHSGFYNTIGRRLYTETTNIFDGSVSFEEKFIIQSQDFVKHSVSFDNGYGNVTETVTLRNSGASTADNFNNFQLNDRFNTAFAGAYTRCNSIYGTYTDALGIDSYTTVLNTQPQQITKAFDERSQELTYSVTYTANPLFTVSGYSIDRELSLSKNTVGIVEAVENGVLTTYAFKDPSLLSFLITNVSAEASGAKNRLASYWSAVSNFKTSSEAKNVSVRGKKGSYSISYTNDPSLIYDGTFISKSITIQDNLPIRMHTPYLVIGRANPLVHNPGQTQLGQAACSIHANLIRPRGYYPLTPNKPRTALRSMFTDALNTILRLLINKNAIDIYVTRITYSYDSNMISDISVEAQYIYARLTNT